MIGPFIAESGIDYLANSEHLCEHLSFYYSNAKFVFVIMEKRIQVIRPILRLVIINLTNITCNLTRESLDTQYCCDTGLNECCDFFTQGCFYCRIMSVNNAIIFGIIGEETANYSKLSDTAPWDNITWDVNSSTLQPISSWNRRGTIFDECFYAVTYCNNNDFGFRNYTVGTMFIVRYSSVFKTLGNISEFNSNDEEDYLAKVKIMTVNHLLLNGNLSICAIQNIVFIIVLIDLF